MKTWQSGLAALVIAATLSGCSAMGSGPTSPDQSSSSLSTTSSSSPSAEAGQDNLLAHTSAYDQTDVVSSVTVGADEHWTGTTPAMSSALKGVGYELIGCEPAIDIIYITVDGYEFSSYMDRTTGYVPLTWLGSKSNGNAYSVSTAAPSTCSVRLDFVDQARGEGRILVFSTGNRQGSEDLSVVLADSSTLILSATCNSSNASFVIRHDGRNTEWVNVVLPAVSTRYYQNFSFGGDIAGDHVLNVQAEGCYWYLIIVQ